MRILELAAGFAGVVAAVLLGSGCASTGAPRDWLPNAELAGIWTNGGWATLRQAGETQNVEGELIALQADTVFVLTTDGLRAVPIGDGDYLRVAGYDSEWGGIAGWTVTGTLSTATHGFYLVLTAPLWILVGTSSAAVASWAPIMRYPACDLEELAAYARFPQGMPPDLDRSSLVIRTRPAPRQHLNRPGIGRAGRDRR